MGLNFFQGMEAMLFDFEGTLVDFQWKLAAAVESALQVLEETGIPRRTIESRKYSTLLKEAVGKAVDFGVDHDLVKEKIGEVYDRYDEDALTRWALRPGAREFLVSVRAKGVRTALVSNVGRKSLARALSKLGLEGLFEVALSRNDVTNLKPSPDGINLALAKMGVAGEDRGLFIGDSLDDVNAARNAGLRVIIITQGENLKEEILAAEPDHVIQGYEELLRAL